jgi:hypothetical protein
VDVTTLVTCTIPQCVNDLRIPQVTNDFVVYERLHEPLLSVLYAPKVDKSALVRT